MTTETNNPGKTSYPSVNLNLNVRGLTPSATLAINELSAELIAQGRDIFKFGLGQSPFPVPRSVVEALKENAHQKDYLPVKGLRELRDAVAQYHGRKHSIQCTGDNVLVGPGSKELMFLIQLVYYGDLCIPTPSWVSYEPQAHIIGRPVRWLRTQADNNWGLMPAELEELCADDPDRPRLVILNYPHNPTGYSYGKDKLRQLAEVARRYRVVLLSDEIYGELHHAGKHTSIAEYYPEGTIISSGLSKWCGAGGWRLGTFTFPDNLHWLLDAMAAVASETFTATSAPIQFAAIKAFVGGPEIESYLSTSRRILSALGQHCAAKLRDAGLRLGTPDGGFYLFPDFGAFEYELRESGVSSSEELCTHLLDKTGVATVPGSAFGRSKDELTLRLAYVDFDGAEAMRAADALPKEAALDEAFLRRYCSRVTDGIDRLHDWLSSMRPQTSFQLESAVRIRRRA
ncbi:MAG: aminotransferase class I/II-fold pyridoxal phosphate-dependent enzyme [Acidobacteria bacterium]|nr:MAG: aminotransferase class I/II-fold pyridoxal phosphate-dependent enzyme [Acidobacteriota bacterium]